LLLFIRGEIMRQLGQVLSVEGDLAQVKVVQHSACASCTHKCGLEHEMKDVYVAAENRIKAETGEIVVLELSHVFVIKAAFWAYIFPLIFLLGGIAFGVFVLESEPQALLIGLTLMVLSYFFTRFVLEPRFKAREQYRLVIVGRADTLDCLGGNE
jgi:sigma-E factor negative regulatory protein RseC